MRGNTSEKSISKIYRTLLIQLLLTLALSALLTLFSGVRGYSALLGGMIYLLPTYYFARRMLNQQHEDDVRQALGSFYKSEIWKMVLTAVLFGVVFTTVKPLDPFSLFGAFVLMQLSFVFAPLIQNSKIFKS